MRMRARAAFHTFVVLTSVCQIAIPLSGQQSSAADGDGARSLFYNPWTGTVLTGSGPAVVPNMLTKSEPVAGVTVQPEKATAASSIRPVPPRPKTSSLTRSVGIHYWVDLEGVGPVADSRTFTTGERIRLHVRSNDDGYLAVWTAGADGGLQLVLPVGGDPAGTPIKSGQEYVGHRVRFQPPATEEHLFLAFARQRQDLPSFEVITAHQLAGARDIVIETDLQTEGEIGTYVINRRGGPIAKEIRLRHVAP